MYTFTENTFMHRNCVPSYSIRIFSKYSFKFAYNSHKFHIIIHVPHTFSFQPTAGYYFGGYYFGVSILFPLSCHVEEQAQGLMTVIIFNIPYTS